MTPITSRFQSIFLPKKVNEFTFDSAVKAVENQRIARITRSALFALASLATIPTILLTEISAISWPIIIPVIVVTLIVYSIFYRINNLDDRYVEGLDDQTRSTLVKKELETLFSTTPRPSTEEIKIKLMQVNQLIGRSLFSAIYLKKIAEVNDHKDDEKSFTELANELGISLSISYKNEWHDQGRYGWDSYSRSINFQWSGKIGDPIEVVRKSEKLDKNGSKTAPEAPSLEAPVPIMS